MEIELNYDGWCYGYYDDIQEAKDVIDDCVKEFGCRRDLFSTREVYFDTWAD
jgi:hypothetical protein